MLAMAFLAWTVRDEIRSRARPRSSAIIALPERSQNSALGKCQFLILTIPPFGKHEFVSQAPNIISLEARTGLSILAST
jgi:hypothetical protein